MNRLQKFVEQGAYGARPGRAAYARGQGNLPGALQRHGVDTGVLIQRRRRGSWQSPDLGIPQGAAARDVVAKNAPHKPTIRGR